ncbi:Rieske (2Fe-2S) protein [Candidatus Woesearchaeota archaeon]|nr:Rieske (2Fe-2S) protein [Candidatus Woesearchaeota archaeon]
MNFIEAASLSELRELKRKLVIIDKNRIALFFLDGKVYAISAVCPHKSGSLDEGYLDEEEIICPSHAFMFNVKTGFCLNHPGYSVRSYEVKIEGEKIFIGFE